MKFIQAHPSRVAVPAVALAVVGMTVAGVQSAAAQTAQPSASQPAIAAPDKLLSLSDIESRLGARGIKVKEIEARDLLLEVEGYDADGREVEIIVDRRNGEILSQRFDK